LDKIFPDKTHIKVPANGLSDEQVLFLGDIFPTGWQAAVQCDIQSTDTVAVWGCGPVGQMTIRSAILLGTKQVVAIDNVPERLAMAKAGGATTINFSDESGVERTRVFGGERFRRFIPSPWASLFSWPEHDFHTAVLFVTEGLVRMRVVGRFARGCRPSDKAPTS
jgi:NADPH:quinone reductase-like Zn-dependent oxidoreductase